jgi:serine/threonine protein kinase
LSHPNIVTVYDFDRDGETAFITMEYIEGHELKQHLRTVKRLPPVDAMKIVERVARGLAYAHQKGFAHSDIKPANVFLGKGDDVKILDFGIAKAFTEATKEKRSAADDLTEGALTPAYASLEMLQGQRAIPSDDVYSLSVMAYEMIHGQHPFIGDDGRPMPADIAKARGAKLQPIPGLQRRHMKALRKGLAFERADRFADASQFIDAIKARNWKRDLTLLGAAVFLAGVGFYSLDFGLEQVVPSVSSLKPELVNVAAMINEGDEFLTLNDVSSANRLFAEALEEANYLTVSDAVERKKVHMILQDRMNKVSELLIDRAQDQTIDEYQLRELAVALEFLLRGKQTSNEDNIEKALDQINERIGQLDSASK